MVVGVVALTACFPPLGFVPAVLAAPAVCCASFGLGKAHPSVTPSTHPECGSGRKAAPLTGGHANTFAYMEANTLASGGAVPRRVRATGMCSRCADSAEQARRAEGKARAEERVKCGRRRCPTRADKAHPGTARKNLRRLGADTEAIYCKACVTAHKAKTSDR